MKMLDFAVSMTMEYINSMPKEQRKKHGQFFTSKETAIFMAELFNIPDGCQKISILDPGAGSGILSIALLERLQTCSNINEIYLVCYENDQNIIELLKKNLAVVCRQLKKKVTYRIICANYILSQKNDYNFMLDINPGLEKFDIVIGNPPYIKIAKNAPEALAMPDICYGAPNLYFLFMSMSMFNLKNGGELVYIIPRSWTSGAYFKKFRQKLFNEGVIQNIHLFVCRDKVFEKESVLQETIIIKMKKTRVHPQMVTISTTRSNADFSKKTIFQAPYPIVVNGSNFYVYLVTSDNEIDVLNKLNTFKSTLPCLGLKMKTGLTVDFRNKNLLRNEAEKNAIPLFYPHHINNGKIIFPVGKGHEYLLVDHKGLIQPNKNYLFIKRFTTKEENRRLQCAVYLAKDFPEYSQISTQNKINFIDGTQDLSEYAVYGLYVLFNSTLYDCYYRILNGSTQVNSTEINSMPIPHFDIIEAMGRKLLLTSDMSEENCNNILGRYI